MSQEEMYGEGTATSPQWTLSTTSWGKGWAALIYCDPSALKFNCVGCISQGRGLGRKSFYVFIVSVETSR